MARMKKVTPDFTKKAPPKKPIRSFFAKLKCIKKRYILIPLAVLAVAFAVTATVFLIPRDNTSFSYECWQLRGTLSDFLDHLCEKDFAAAAETVCFISEEDGSVLQSDSALRALWAKRMQDLGSGVSNTYLKSYEDLSVRKENGEMIVTVSLQVMRQGFPDTFYQNAPHRIFVVCTDGAWKFVGISDAELQTDFEKCISGRISSSPSEVAP